jgi:predicted RNA-binding protein with PUA-like domain
MNYWLMKSEPNTYSLADLAREGQTCWDGVRNYQARNLMRDEMQVGDLVLFYHSNAAPMGVVGVAQISRAAYPDPTAWDPADPHYDPKSQEDAPVWVMVDIAYVATLPRIVTLAEIKADPELQTVMVAQKGSRLSIQPVSEAHFARVCCLGGWEPYANGSPA